MLAACSAHAVAGVNTAEVDSGVDSEADSIHLLLGGVTPDTEFLSLLTSRSLKSSTCESSSFTPMDCLKDCMCSNSCTGMVISDDKEKKCTNHPTFSFSSTEKHTIIKTGREIHEGSVHAKKHSGPLRFKTISIHNIVSGGHIYSDVTTNSYTTNEVGTHTSNGATHVVYTNAVYVDNSGGGNNGGGNTGGGGNDDYGGGGGGGGGNGDYGNGGGGSSYCDGSYEALVNSTFYNDEGTTVYYEEIDFYTYNCDYTADDGEGDGTLIDTDTLSTVYEVHTVKKRNATTSMISLAVGGMAVLGLAALYKRQKDYDKRHPLTGSVKRRGVMLRSLSGLESTGSFTMGGGSVINSRASYHADTRV